MATSSFDDSMEVVMVLDETGSIDMEVDLPDQQHMIMELQSCRSSIKVKMPTENQQTFLGLPVESSRVNYSDFLYIVLDTNVLISHLKFLQELKNQTIKGIGRPVLIVPWVVIQELDSLKSGGKRSIAGKAFRAGKFINECLSAKHPRVRGQTVEEVNTEIQNMAIVNNDDRILHCCLVYQYKIKIKGQRGMVILFSNDNVLCAKSKMNNLIACDRNNLLSELKKISESSPSTAPVSYTHTTEYEGKVNKVLVEDHQMKLVEDCLCQAEEYCRDALSVIVDYEMTQVYGNLCNDIMIRKPPWSMEDVMVMLDKHWVAVFRYVFTARMPGGNHQETIKWLLNHAKNRTSMSPMECDVVKFIDNTLLLLEQMRNKPEVWSKISVFVASLKVLKEKMARPHSQSFPTTPTAVGGSGLQQNSGIIPNGAVPVINGGIPPHLSRTNIDQIINHCPELPIDRMRWTFQVIRESLLCGIISAQTSFANMTLNRHTEIWLIDVLRLIEGLIMAIESILTQELYITVLQSFHGAVQSYFNSILSTPCLLSFGELCDACQHQNIIGLFQDGLVFMIDGRMQLLRLLQQTAQSHRNLLPS